jgi:hypothetical protein
MLLEAGQRLVIGVDPDVKILSGIGYPALCNHLPGPVLLRN